MIGLYKLLCRMRAALVIILVPLAIATWMPVPAAAISSEEAARKIAAEFPVKVLRVRADVLGNTPVWLVTAMKAGGNRNDAFQVITLAVDQESGELVPAFRHGVSGYTLREVQGRSTRLDQRPEAIRSGVWR